jgi:hypothetical protein
MRGDASRKIFHGFLCPWAKSRRLRRVKRYRSDSLRALPCEDDPMPTLTLPPVGDRNAPETVAPAGTPVEPIAPLEEAVNWPPSAHLSAALHRARAKAFLARRRPHRQHAP